MLVTICGFFTKWRLFEPIVVQFVFKLSYSFSMTLLLSFGFMWKVPPAEEVFGDLHIFGACFWGLEDILPQPGGRLATVSLTKHENSFDTSLSTVSLC